METETNVIRWSAPAVRTLDIEGRLARQLSPDTLAHVYRTAAFARDLADRHGIDPDRAELAALVHEVADGYDDDQLLALAAQYELPLDPIEARVPRLLHGRVGAEILRFEWGITDEGLLEAVRHHVAGAAKMGTLAKVIFLADKLEPDRDKFYGDLDPVRQLALSDLDAAVGRMSAWRLPQLPLASAARPDRVLDAADTLAELTRATWPA